jgi:glutamate racemase
MLPQIPRIFIEVKGPVISKALTLMVAQSQSGILAIIWGCDGNLDKGGNSKLNGMMKIGVFDSGVGGLTVLKELALCFPADDFYYLGDTARLPYGIKSPATIRLYSEQVMNFLMTKGVEAIVIACNTASSQVPEVSWSGVPVFNVIEPGAMAALRTSKTKRIGVLGTRATIASEIYARKINALDKSAEVFSQSCPLLVPLAEEGWVVDLIIDGIVARYLQPVLKHRIDTLILGCTHYPILKDSIQKACGPDIQLVDSGRAICEKMKSSLKRELRANKTGGKIYFLATDISEHSLELSKQILAPLKFETFELVHL